MSEIIAIFNRNVTLTAFIEVQGRGIEYEIIDGSVQHSLKKFRTFLTKHYPRTVKEIMRPHGQRLIILQTVLPSDATYTTAIYEELKRNGFLAARAHDYHKKLLLFLQEAVGTVAQRRKLLAQILSCDEQVSSQLSSLLVEMEDEAVHIKKDRDELLHQVAEIKKLLLKKTIGT